MRHPLQRVAAHLEHRRRRRQYPNIVNAGVSHPHLVHSTAQISGANLSGPIRVGEHARIEGPLLLLGRITIGRYTTINGPNTDIFSRVHPVEIGAFCSIARSVTVQEYNHPTDHCATAYVLERIFGEENQEAVSRGPVVVGSDVWIGAQSLILAGARIGEGAVIGANSVVNGSIPPFAVAVGSPARVIRYRFPPEVRECLAQIKWWDWPEERLRQNRRLFEGALTPEKLLEIV